MVMKGKVEPEGRLVRSGPSFCEVQITGLPEGSNPREDAGGSSREYIFSHLRQSFSCISGQFHNAVFP